MNKPFNQIFRKGFAVILLVALMFSVSSCNRRQAVVLKKIINEIDHAEESRDNRQNYQGGEVYEYAEPQQNTTSASNEIRYSIYGIFQIENTGEIKAINNNVVIQTNSGLFLADGLGQISDRVFENDIATITETRVVRYSFDENETETRPVDVSGYEYKCYNGIVTFYFNISHQLN